MRPVVCVTSANLPDVTSMRAVKRLLIRAARDEFEVCEFPEIANIHIHVGTPHALPQGMAHGPNRRMIFYAASEATRIPESWVRTLNQCNEVWSPSFFARDAMLASGVTVPIRVIPHGVESRDSPTRRYMEGKTEPFTFMWQGSKLRRYEDGKPFDGDRKRGHLVEKAFQEAKLPGSRLILKYLPVEGISYDVRVGSVWYICKSLSAHDMDELDARTDAFIWPTMGEGFGMPPLEKLSAGIPAFATYWSGPLEYQQDFPLRRLPPTRLQPVRFNGVEAEMAYIEECAVIDLMKYCFENRTELSNMRLDLFATARRWTAEQMLKPRLLEALWDVASS